jgi:hypothetical protein
MVDITRRVGPSPSDDSVEGTLAPMGFPRSIARTRDLRQHAEKGVHGTESTLKLVLSQTSRLLLKVPTARWVCQRALDASVQSASEKPLVPFEARYDRT